MFKSCDSLPFLKAGLGGTLSMLKGNINSKYFRCDSYHSLWLINHLTYPLLNPLMRKYIGELRTQKKQSIITESTTLLDQLTEIPSSLSNVVTKNSQVFDKLYKEENPEHIYGFLKMVLALYGCPFYSFDDLEMLEPHLFRNIFRLPIVYETEDVQREIFYNGFNKIEAGLETKGLALELTIDLYENIQQKYSHSLRQEYLDNTARIRLLNVMRDKILKKTEKKSKRSTK